MFILSKHVVLYIVNRKFDLMVCFLRSLQYYLNLAVTVLSFRISLTSLVNTDIRMNT